MPNFTNIFLINQLLLLSVLADSCLSARRYSIEVRLGLHILPYNDRDPLCKYPSIEINVVPDMML